MDRRSFLSTVGLAPLAAKYRFLQKAFGVEYFDPMKGNLLLQEEILGISRNYWDLVRASQFVFVKSEIERDDGSVFILKQWVAHVMARRISDDTHFYSNVSFNIDAPNDSRYIRTKCQYSVMRFDDWKDCECNVDGQCYRHGGHRGILP